MDLERIATEAVRAARAQWKREGRAPVTVPLCALDDAAADAALDAHENGEDAFAAAKAAAYDTLADAARS